MVSFSILTAQAKRVNQLYVIGGDGTHRGAYKLAELCWEKGVDVSVAGVPKTIDNDIGADSAWVSEVFRTSTCVDGVDATSRHRDAVNAAAREPTRLVRESRPRRHHRPVLRLHDRRVRSY